MSEDAQTAEILVRPAIAWAVAGIAGLAADWLEPLPFVPDDWPGGLIGATVFMLALALAVWAADTMTLATSNGLANRSATGVVDKGPYGLTRNPICLGMLGGQVGLAIAFDTLWLLATLVPFALVIRYGVVGREEAYLERKFGQAYRDYRKRVRRWL